MIIKKIFKYKIIAFFLSTIIGFLISIVILSTFKIYNNAPFLVILTEMFSDLTALLSIIAAFTIPFLLMDLKEKQNNQRIQNIFEVIKKIFNSMIFLTEPEDFGGYKKYMIALKEWDNKKLEDPALIAEIIVQEIKNFLDNFKNDLRYLAINNSSPHIAFFGDRYVIQANPSIGNYLLIKKFYVPNDYNKIISQILNEIKGYSKFYFGIKIK